MVEAIAMRIQRARKSSTSKVVGWLVPRLAPLGVLLWAPGTRSPWLLGLIAAACLVGVAVSLAQSLAALQRRRAHTRLLAEFGAAAPTLRDLADLHRG
jgi:hypothetical protein